MFAHYIKITFRNIWKYKIQSFTGIFGLAFGLACFIPTLYWMRYETSFDSFYPDSEHIHRIYIIEKQSGKVNELAPGILGKNLHQHFPAVVGCATFFSEINNCKTAEIPHIQLRILNTDSTFFQVFMPEFVSGDLYQPLHTLFNIVITESVAIRLFGDVEKAIGQQIQSTFYFFNPPYIVTAVVKDPPPNTNLPFDALLHHDLLAGMATGPEELQWKSFNTQLYIKFAPQADPEYYSQELRDFTSQLDVNPDIELGIVPINDVRHRLASDISFTLNFVHLFLAAGILLLFSAVFNFLNLYLDLFRQRSREFRQRNVHGASSGQLILQMLFEMWVAILVALLFACGFVFLIRPIFSRLLEIKTGVTGLSELFVICGIGIMGLMLLIGFIVFWRLSYLATQNLSKIKTTGQPILRRMAVILQLAISIVFIVAALVVMGQIRFVNNKDLGFNHNGVIQLYGLSPYIQTSVRTGLIHELTTIPQIISISTSNFVPLHDTNTMDITSHVDWPGKSPDEKPVFNIIPTDHRFAEILGLKMLMGDWFNEGGGQKVVLNKEAVRVMGLDEPVGTTIRMSEVDFDIDARENQNVEYLVVGVVNDFHTQSLRSRIHPTIFRQPVPVNEWIVTGNILYIHVFPGQEQEAIQRISSLLPDIDPSYVDLRVMTLDEVYDSFNHSEQVGFKMFSALATVCLLISLFGIYAVATASTQRRRKEIAVRKVVGAKACHILFIFFREYTLKVFIAGAFALPLAYLAMSRWLQGYAYRMNISLLLLAMVLIGVVAVVCLTILGQVLKAANSNPAEVVKSE